LQIERSLFGPSLYAFSFYFKSWGIMSSKTCDKIGMDFALRGAIALRGRELKLAKPGGVCKEDIEGASG